MKSSTQLELAASTSTRVQVGDPNVPVDVLPAPRLRPTTPEGVRVIPAVDVSLTVTLQTDAVFTVTGLEQVMMIEVVRGLTTTLAEVTVELPL